jgi:hypothetical protein
VNGDAIGLGGAGYLGVDAAVMAAQRHGAATKSLVLLSGQAVIPGRQFMAQATQLPGLFVVADADEYPPTEEVMEWLYGLSGNPGSRFIHYVGPKAPWNGYETLPELPPSGTHGTDLFQTHPELVGTIVDWFVTTLIRTPGRAPAQKGRAPISLNVALLQEMEQPGGAARVGERLMEARRKDPKTQRWPWVVGNVLGTDHLMAGDNKLAIDLYKLNVLAYPDSADGLDSLADAYLADAYLADGQKDLARQYTEKALALVASDPELSEPRRKLVRDSLGQKAVQLGIALPAGSR